MSTHASYVPDSAGQEHVGHHRDGANHDMRNGAAQADGNNVQIKGRSDGVSIEIGRGNWSETLESLAKRLQTSADFFRGSRVTLDVGARTLHTDELRQLCLLLHHYNMSATAIRSTSPDTFQSALDLGLASSLDAPDIGLPGAFAQQADSNIDTTRQVIYYGNVRSGQILKQQATTIIIGDVNPGAQVVSAGSILVWGRLRGIAHAGARGDRQAIVTALHLAPTQLRIANLIAIEPDTKSNSGRRWFQRTPAPPVKQPEIAFIRDNNIIIDVWESAKPGNLLHP